LKAGEDANPAAKVHWWRVVLDESHNIKDPVTVANKACPHLTSGRRWCVSGTPITNKLEDLIGQFCFLHLSPLDSPTPFAALSSHSVKLLALLRRILIRHSKSQRILRLANGQDDDGVVASGAMKEQPLLPLRCSRLLWSTLTSPPPLLLLIQQQHRHLRPPRHHHHCAVATRRRKRVKVQAKVSLSRTRC
jgi:hypothetical protein